MKRSLLILTCLAASCPPAIASAAESNGSLHWSNGAVLSTEHVCRGQSLTDGKPSIVGELKLNHDNGAYAGLWAGNLNLGPTDTSVELDYFFGWV